MENEQSVGIEPLILHNKILIKKLLSLRGSYTTYSVIYIENLNQNRISRNRDTFKDN